MDVQEIGWETIIGTVPSKSNGLRFIGGRTYKSKAITDYEKTFWAQCIKYRYKGISKPFELSLNVYYPSRRSDLDGSFKIILDMLQTCGAITNDRNCTKIIAERFIDKLNPRIEFRITPI